MPSRGHPLEKTGILKKKIEPKGIYDLLGVALGCIGLSYDDFCRLSFEEFAAIYRAYAEQRDIDFKDRWNMARMHAYLSICPHVDQRKRKVTPQMLLPFPWDGQKPAEKSPAMTAEQQRKRMKELAERLGYKMINE